MNPKAPVRPGWIRGKWKQAFMYSCKYYCIWDPHVVHPYVELHLCDTKGDWGLVICWYILIQNKVINVQFI